MQSSIEAVSSLSNHCFLLREFYNFYFLSLSSYILLQCSLGPTMDSIVVIFSYLNYHVQSPSQAMICILCSDQNWEGGVALPLLHRWLNGTQGGDVVWQAVKANVWHSWWVPSPPSTRVLSYQSLANNLKFLRSSFLVYKIWEISAATEQYPDNNNYIKFNSPKCTAWLHFW